ncbi:zinc-binding alcohol dehydrogenase [Roseomonas sp. OT10]|nr:zinc-binding alcohol dehydrogenase [Roseomonas sp. OT10]UFN51363.1 zinc-binding alcohol dehydrogenase [Roseomonas sp. OT10]
MTARALWTVAPGHAELREEILPEPGPDQALVRMLASGVSRGTERLVLHGRVPRSQWATMGAPLMEGALPFPVKYGYAAVGLVEAGPEPLMGRRVFCLHPHQDRFLAPAAMCIPVPDAVPDTRAVLAANMETALNIVWDARPLPGERALVIGAGVVGLLTAWLLSRIPALDLALVDVDPRRREVAARLGLRLVAPGEAPEERELIVHASASAEGLQLALRCAAMEGRILEASWFGDRAVPLPLGEAFHARRLSLLSTQVGQVAPAMRGRRSHVERLALALSLLREPALDALCGPLVAFPKLADSLPGLLDAPAGGAAPLCPVVLY